MDKDVDNLMKNPTLPVEEQITKRRRRRSFDRQSRTTKQTPITAEKLRGKC